MRAALIALLVGGCSMHSGVSVGSGAPPASAAATASIEVRAGPAVGALIGLGYMVGIAREEEGRAPRSAPPLDPGRRVLEQDCSRPLTDPAANLRCR